MLCHECGFITLLHQWSVGILLLNIIQLFVSELLFIIIIILIQGIDYINSFYYLNQIV